MFIISRVSIKVNGLLPKQALHSVVKLNIDGFNSVIYDN